MHNWRQIIWREWRNTSDLEFAERLFDLVADTPPGWGGRLSLIFLSIASGASLGVLVGLPVSFRWSVLQYLAIVGGIAGAARAFVLSRELTWGNWIHRLEANTPTGSLSRVVTMALLLACIGGMIFGPLFWLMVVGLFWAIGGVIVWINRSMDEVSSYNPDDRRWWAWWRKRPDLVELQSALENACNESPAAAEVWTDPLRRLAEKQRRPTSPQELVNALSSHDWVERFVARHTLISLGQKAVFGLQALATQNQTPLQDTARWLLENIRR